MKMKTLLLVLLVAGMVTSCGSGDITGVTDTVDQSVTATVTENKPGSGKYGHPFNAVPTTVIYSSSQGSSPVYDLAALGYVEREFIISGKTNTYNQSGWWGSDGRWNVSVAKSNVPYTTRIIVRYPTNPAKFNGTVVFEWMNDITYSETSPDWADSHDFFFREGYAYVGVTAQNLEAGPPFLKWWDPGRYGKLSISTDGQSYDIFTQVAQVVKAQTSTILGGLTPKKLLGCGDSAAAIRLTTYVNAIHPRARVYDGFLIHGRASTEAPIDNGIINLFPNTQIRTDNTTPVLQLQAEGDLSQLFFSWGRQPDNNYLRTWEMAGAAHIDLHEGIYEVTVAYRDLKWKPPVCTFGVPSDFGGGLANSLPNYRIEAAAWAALDKWVKTGKAAPSANRIQTGFFNIISFDQYGNARGGLRLPEMDVPIKTYTAYNTTTDSLGNINTTNLFSLLLNISNPSWVVNPTSMALRALGLCLLEGFDTPFDAATLKKLYPTHADYVNKYKAAADKLLKAGFLTQVDYNEAIAEAQAAKVP